MFYILYQSYRSNPEEFVPAWKFVGELHITEFDIWFFMSYKCPANGVSIYFENPDLIERRQVTGKSGSKYYEYRLKAGASRERIVEPKLLSFYDQLRKRL